MLLQVASLEGGGDVKYLPMYTVHVHMYKIIYLFIYLCMYVCNSCHMVDKEVWSLSALSVV